MLKTATLKLIFPILAISFSVAWLLYMMTRNEVPVDVGDGLMHFFYAQASWENPNLLLHHWGKPLYILLSSPFAQFGLNGTVLFNILLFLGTSILGLKILSRFNISNWVISLFPLILIHANDYSTTVLAGLTEPLFNFALVLSLYLLLNKKYLWFAIVVSLMPFMRSEGQLPVLLAIVLLLHHRSYRSIPLLFSGFVLFAIAGLFVYHDFWWYFTKSPYSLHNDIYGQGTWDHYLISYKNYLGNPGLYILILGVPVMVWFIFRRKWLELQPEWAFYAYGTFLGIVGAHSYFWATGQNGSMGLTRIATQGMPIFLLLHLYYIGRCKWFKHWSAQILFGVFSLVLVIVLSTSKFFPVKANAFDLQIMKASTYMKDRKDKKQKIFYHHPLFAYSFGENPFLINSQCVFHTFGALETDLSNVLKSGDYVIWDSHFGPVEANLPLEEIEKHSELVKIRSFLSNDPVDQAGHERDGIIIYQYTPKPVTN